MKSDPSTILSDRLKRLNIREQDLREQFVRSGGKGGQNVNKVSTCVILTHVPTGLSVRCEEERSQSRNRFLARERLADRWEEKIRLDRQAERMAFEKKRRTNRKRSKKSKERMREQKARRSKLKKSRHRPNVEYD